MKHLLIGEFLTVPKTGATTKYLDLSSVKGSDELHHTELKPETEFVYRAIWRVLGPYQRCRSWEEFEFVTCQNETPENEIPYFAYVCGRFQQYRADNPAADNFKLRKAFASIVRDYFALQPYLQVSDGQGNVELQLVPGFDHPTCSEAERKEAFEIADKWLEAVLEAFGQ